MSDVEEFGVRAYRDSVVVIRNEKETKTDSGIILVEGAQELPSEGKIVSVGSGHMFDNGEMRPLDVFVGDKVLFGKFAGKKIIVNGIEHVVLKEEEILAILTYDQTKDHVQSDIEQP
jgi:chaperonin GroES